MKQSSMQVSNSNVVRPWKLELKAMETKQYDKEGVFFGRQKARKNGPPQFKIPAVVSGQISFNLK